MKSFGLVLGSTLDKTGKSKTKHKEGETLVFTVEDPREITSWVNDITAVVRRRAPF